MFIEKISDETYLEFQMKYAEYDFLCEHYLHEKTKDSDFRHETNLFGYIAIMNPRPTVVSIFDPSHQKHFLPIRQNNGDIWISYSFPEDDDTKVAYHTYPENIVRSMYLSPCDVEDIKNNLVELLFYDIYATNSRSLKVGLKLEYV